MALAVSPSVAVKSPHTQLGFKAIAGQVEILPPSQNDYSPSGDRGYFFKLLVSERGRCNRKEIFFACRQNILRISQRCALDPEVGIRSSFNGVRLLNSDRWRLSKISKMHADPDLIAGFVHAPTQTILRIGNPYVGPLILDKALSSILELNHQGDEGQESKNGQYPSEYRHPVWPARLYGWSLIGLAACISCAACWLIGINSRSVRGHIPLNSTRFVFLGLLVMAVAFWLGGHALNLLINAKL